MFWYQLWILNRQGCCWESLWEQQQGIPVASNELQWNFFRVWLIKQAKTADLEDGNAFFAWKNLVDRYSPNSTSDLMVPASQFSKCTWKTQEQDPDEWFIELELLCTQMKSINNKFAKEGVELIAHIIDKIPSDYSDVVTTVKVLLRWANNLKPKIWAFYKRTSICKQGGFTHRKQ